MPDPPAALVERRRAGCRLDPALALGSLEEAEAFLEDRGLLTLTPDSALPSLFEACPEEPYRPGGHGFAAWPRTKYGWGGELAERPGVVAAKIHRGKRLFLSPATVALADPVCRAELERMREADAGWRRLLDYLAEAGPATLEVVQAELGYRQRELRSLRSPLERCGVIVARSVERPDGTGEGHLHTSELARWDQVVPVPPPDAPADAGAGVEAIVVAGVRAAVVAREREVLRWFSWSWRVEGDLVARLVDGGRLDRPAPGWVSLPERIGEDGA